jgi:hypothetical protein
VVEHRHAALALLAFAVANLDGLPMLPDPRPRFWEAAQLAGASAILWLPVFLLGFSCARRQAEREAQ